jgi:hypothetical protein
MTSHAFRGIVLLVSACLFGAAARGSVIYNESVSGDLSNSGLTPTLLTVSLGSNQVFGTTGNTTAVDRDYFTFTVPASLVLSSITLLPGTETLGPLGDSFIGVQLGPQVTLGTSPPNASGLLGWFHYSTGDIGANILPLMGSAGLGSTGFTPPLPSGTYSFWVQELSTGTVPYGLDFTTQTPEPGSWAMLLVSLTLLTARAAHKRTRN